MPGLPVRDGPHGGDGRQPATTCLAHRSYSRGITAYKKKCKCKKLAIVQIKMFQCRVDCKTENTHKLLDFGIYSFKISSFFQPIYPLKCFNVELSGVTNLISSPETYLDYQRYDKFERNLFQH